MRPVDRPPWRPEWAALGAGEAAAIALGHYCSACELPLPHIRIGWHPDTGEVVTGPVRPTEWDGLLVLCRHCAHAATGQGHRGSPLLPDRDPTFAFGPAAPFSYRRDGDEVHVVANGERAADTVRLFGLNTRLLVDPVLRGTRSERHRREFAEFDDPRLPLRTAAWDHARQAVELYARMPGERDREHWAVLLADVVQGRGFWSVWAAVLGASDVDESLVAAVLAVPHRSTVDEDVAGAPPAAEYPFPATRLVWPPAEHREQV